MNEKCVPVCAKQTNVVTQTCYLFFNELGYCLYVQKVAFIYIFQQKMCNLGGFLLVNHHVR